MLMPRILLTVASLLMAAAVALAAVGAHALPDIAHPGGIWWTAVFWHAVTGVALFAVGAGWGRFHWAWGTLGAAMMAVGVVLFSGTLYVQGVNGWGQGTFLAPTGGTLLILAWLSLAVAAMRGPR
jgi:uncharacterized membrane protein YgdD (TMEM256/DUF423 family)